MRKEKSKFLAYVLWLFLGGFGAHYFYLNEPLWGIIKLFTGNGCFIGWIIDLFLVGNMVDTYNAQVRADNLERQLQQATTALHNAAKLVATPVATPPVATTAPQPQEHTEQQPPQLPQ